MTSSAISARRTSLAECQASANGPVPIAVALRIVIDLARAFDATHGRAEAAGGHAHRGVSTAHVLVGDDGTVAFADEGGLSDDRRSASYLSPEQVCGSALDGRSDVFSVGVLLWELLTGTPLFDRDTEAATSLAILEAPIREVCSVNPDVPPVVGEVVATALARDKQARFDNVAALGKALAGASAASGITEATAQDVGRWVAGRVARNAADLLDAVPDLDVPGPRPARGPVNAPSTPSAPEIAPPSVRSARAAATPQNAIPFDSGDDDDFDMQIERNLTTSGMPTSTSAQPSGGQAERSSAPHSARASDPRLRSGLELGAPQRLSARGERNERSAEAGLVARIGGFLGAMIVLGGTSAALFRYIHHAGGRPVTSLLPHAFDGTSGNESGAVALVSLVVAVAIIFVGLRLQPHAWSIVASGGSTLLLALAMVTVTLASTGENPTPPDGALLVPYAAPVALLLLALGMGGRAGRILARARGIRRLGGVPLAAIAGLLAFAAFEVSNLATRL